MKDGQAVYVDFEAQTVIYAQRPRVTVEACGSQRHPFSTLPLISTLYILKEPKILLTVKALCQQRQ